MVTIQPSVAQRQRDLLDAVRSVELPNGVRLPYVEQGDPDGVPVVFLHGITDSWRSWETVLPRLPSSIHAVALTQRGHGDADRPESGYRFEDFAADLADLVDALELEMPVFVGHSLGSYVVQRYVLDHPDRVLGLMLVGSVTTWRGNPVIAQIWDTAFSTLEDPIDPDFVREFQDSPRLPRAHLEIAVEESLKTPARVWRAAWQAMRETDYSAELGNIAVPALIAWGDADPLCPREEQEALVEAIPDSRLVTFPGGGHNLHWEEPERIAAELVKFVQSVAG